MVNCPKCKNDDHSPHLCDKPWPYHTEQICDRCGGPHETGNPLCKIKTENFRLCKICGHERDHMTAMCPIKNSGNEEHLKQWTKTKYDATLREMAGKSNKKKVTTQPGPSTPAKSLNAGAPSNVSVPNTTRPSSSKPPGRNQVSSSGIASHVKVPNTTAPGSSLQGSASTGPVTLMKPKITRARDNRALPDLTPTQAENLKYAKLNSKLSDFSSSQAEKPNQVTTNFIKVTIDKDVGIRKYRIVLGKDGQRTITNRDAKRALIDEILRGFPQHAKFGVTDYFSHIISVGKLYNHFVDERDAAWSVIHQRHGRGQTVVQMDSTIFFEGLLDTAKLKQYIDPAQPLDVNYLPAEDLRMLNMLSCKHILDRREPGGMIVRVGKKFYPLEADLDTSNLNINGPGDKIPACIVRRGFFSSMRPANGRLVLNVNATATGFCPNIKLQDYINSRSTPIPSASLGREMRELKVIFSADQAGKHWPIKAFALLNSSTLDFDFHGVRRTVLNHMNLAKSIPLRDLDPSAACVQVGQIGSGEKIWYPADQLTIVAHQAFKGKMSGNMTSAMLKFTMKRPNENETMILNYARQALGIKAFPFRGVTVPEIYKDFGLTVAQEFLQTESRLLQAPVISFRNQRGLVNLDIYASSKFCAEANGAPQRGKMPARDSATWDLKKVTSDKLATFFRLGTHGGEFLLMYLAQKDFKTYPDQKSKDKAVNISRDWTAMVKRFAQGFHDSLRNDYGFKLPNSRTPMRLECDPRLHGVALRRELNGCFKVLEANIPSNSVLVVCLDSKDVSVYSDVKWWGDCRAGIKTICVSPEAVIKGAGNDRNLFGNLALKYNFRLGGVGHSLSAALGLKGTTMIVGADVSHSGQCIDQYCPSMAGVVATCDTIGMTYLASARLQPKDTEHIANLEDMIVERLQCWRAKNKALPEHILFYRDGVSESQYGMVRETELSQILLACRQVGGTTPRITLVIVGKRHHARFYSTKPGDPQNVRSGLVVDSTVVYPKQFNFYLQAHDSPIGTARNAHYVVLENESGYNADELQEITNKICFMGSRATKGLSVCTPARYADILCDRLRRYMRLALESDAYTSQNLDTYRRDFRLWGAPEKDRANPWHPRLNDVMFYL